MMKLLIPILTILCVIAASAVFIARRGNTAATENLPEAAPGSFKPGKPGEPPEADDGARAPVIVELFTSEGCSSCPPADIVLTQLQKTQPVAGAEVIALSEHVDYWNYIGWTDPFSSSAFSARQETYAQSFRRESIYTPQMVVDGQIEFVGNSLDKAHEAIAKAARLPKADVKITLPQTKIEPQRKIEKDDPALKLSVSVKNVPAINQGDVAEVLLVFTEDDLSSNVARGENSGRKLIHTAVVREMRALGAVDPATKGFNSETTSMIAGGWRRENLRAIAIVQERAHRRVLGAASIKLKTTGD
jgi:hypothetical protein